MSRPLQVKRETVNAGVVWHADVFAEFGPLCWFGKRQGHPKRRATDAAHVLGRGTKLGPLRFCSPRLGRPLCRECHDRQGRHEIEFALKDRRDAILAHNKVSKIKLVVPDA